MRRLILVVSAVFALSGSLPVMAQAAPLRQAAPTAQTVGIGLVDIPVKLADDPRAREYIIDHVAPGTTITRRVEISNNTAETQVVQVYPAAASIAGGDFLFGAGRAVNDLTTWTSISPPTVRPAAGTKVLVTVNITVPADAAPGERYGVIWAQPAPAAPSGGGITEVNRVGVRMYLSIGNGATPATNFSITALQARRTAKRRPEVLATVTNTGGRAIDLSGELRLTNGPGGLSAGPFAATLGTTLGLGQVEPVVVTLDPAIPSGPWDAHIVLRSGTTQREASAHITFPDTPATSAAPVRAKPDSKGSGGLLFALSSAAAIIGLLVVAVLLLLQRRHQRRPAGTSSPGALGP